MLGFDRVVGAIGALWDKMVVGFDVVMTAIEAFLKQKLVRYAAFFAVWKSAQGTITWAWDKTVYGGAETLDYLGGDAERDVSALMHAPWMLTAIERANYLFPVDVALMLVAYIVPYLVAVMAWRVWLSHAREIGSTVRASLSAHSIG